MKRGRTQNLEIFDEWRNSDVVKNGDRGAGEEPGASVGVTGVARKRGTGAYKVSLLKNFFGRMLSGIALSSVVRDHFLSSPLASRLSLCSYN